MSIARPSSSSWSSLTNGPLILTIPKLYGDIEPHHLILLYSTLQILKSTKIYQKLADKIIQGLSRTTDILIPLVYCNIIPDCLIRFGIRLRLKDQLIVLKETNCESDMMVKMQIVSELKSMPVAIQTDTANDQHYEVPAAFYDLCLGRRKKYSSGLWLDKNSTFPESEVAMLDLYFERAGVKDGMSIVDLGCGWGSVTLYLLEKYPNVKVTSISNSHSQRAYITKTATDKGFNTNNLTIVTCNVSDDKGALDGVKDNDLVITIEMFEHMKNYSTLLQKVHGFLKPTGKLFIHIFTHKNFTYHFEDGWMADNFFSGGTMPSDDLMLYFAENFHIVKHWRVNGSNYEKTSNGWLNYLDTNWKNGSLKPVLKEAYGESKEKEWYVNWRLFFLACAELWAFDGGNEWIVSNFFFQKRS